MKISFITKKNKSQIEIPFLNLAEIWKKIDGKQSKRFKRFLVSPYFNIYDNNDLPKLYQELKKSIERNSKRISGQMLCKKLYKVKNLDKLDEVKYVRKFITTFEQLEKLTEQFLMHEEVKNDLVLNKKILVRVKKKQNTVEFLKACNELQQQLNFLPATMNRIKEEWALDDQLFFHQYPSSIPRKLNHLESAELKSLQVLQIAQLKYKLAKSNRSKTSSPIEVKNKIVTLVDEKPLTKLASIFQKLILTLDKDDIIDQNYSSFKTEFFKEQDNLSLIDKFLVVKITINYCIRAFIKGDQAGMVEIFFWTSYAMKEELFFIEGEMGDAEFINVLLSALISKENDTFKKWKKISSAYLSPEIRTKALDIIEGYELVNKKEFEKAIELLTFRFPKKSKNPLAYSLRVKTLLLISYMMYYLESGETLHEFKLCKKSYLELVRSSKSSEMNKKRKLLNEGYIFFCQEILDLYESRFKHRNSELEKAKETLLEKLKTIKMFSMHQLLRIAILGIKK